MKCWHTSFVSCGLPKHGPAQAEVLSSPRAGSALILLAGCSSPPKEHLQQIFTDWMPCVNAWLLTDVTNANEYELSNKSVTLLVIIPAEKCVCIEKMKCTWYT